MESRSSNPPFRVSVVVLLAPVAVPARGVVEALEALPREPVARVLVAGVHVAVALARAAVLARHQRVAVEPVSAPMQETRLK